MWTREPWCSLQQVWVILREAGRGHGAPAPEGPSLVTASQTGGRRDQTGPQTGLLRCQKQSRREGGREGAGHGELPTV